MKSNNALVPMVITEERLDANPMLLGCANGVVDLRIGRHRPGRPNEWIENASPFDFPKGPEIEHYLRTGEGCPCPVWEEFLLCIMGGAREMVDYLRRGLGYGSTGLTTEHIFLIFYGGGRNGKGTLIEILQKIMGPLAVTIQPEMLLNHGRARNPSGPSPDIKALKGKRFAFAGETEQWQRMAQAQVKRITSSDTLVCRGPHDRHQTTFRPAHLLILSTNYKPKASADDAAFWARIHLVNFPLSFVERPSAPHERRIDRRLEEKLLAEASGILAWLVRGCLEWQEQGLNPPPAVLEATAQYRRGEDDLADFLEEKCTITEEAEVTAKAIYTAFKEWFLANIADKAPSQKRFGEMLSRRFQKDHNGPGKTVRYLGLELKGIY